MKVTFLGAASTVTGSRHLLSANGKKYLIDCGILQGPESEENGKSLNDHYDPNDFKDLSGVFITHAHIDHCGYLPFICKKGYLGPIYTTHETKELMKISLEDSANLLRESVPVESRNKKFFFDKNDVNAMLSRVKVLTENEIHKINELEVKFLSTSHILGSCFVKFSSDSKVITFSGDLGRYNSLIHKDPSVLEETDCLVVESTYGNKTHPKLNYEEFFSELFDLIEKRGSTLIIPAFSIDRTQMLLSEMTKAMQVRSSRIPIILTGTMGIEVTKVYEKYCDKLKVTSSDFTRIHKFTRTIHYHNELSHFWETSTGPQIVIAGGGMMTGGTILGHLKQFGTDSKNIILITGFQAKETLGAKLLLGEKEVEIEGNPFSIMAEVRFIPGLSAHADQNDIRQWIGNNRRLKTIFLVHGEPEARIGLSKFLSKGSNAKVILPSERNTYSIDGVLEAEN